MIKKVYFSTDHGSYYIYKLFIKFNDFFNMNKMNLKTEVPIFNSENRD